MLQRRRADGLQVIKAKKLAVGTPDDAICDIEALLIMAMGPQNMNHMNFKLAEKRIQVKLDERERYLGKIR